MFAPGSVRGVAVRRCCWRQRRGGLPWLGCWFACAAMWLGEPVGPAVGGGQCHQHEGEACMHTPLQQHAGGPPRMNAASWLAGHQGAASMGKALTVILCAFWPLWCLPLTGGAGHRATWLPPDCTSPTALPFPIGGAGHPAPYGLQQHRDCRGRGGGAGGTTRAFLRFVSTHFGQCVSSHAFVVCQYPCWAVCWLWKPGVRVQAGGVWPEPLQPALGSEEEHHLQPLQLLG